MLILAKYAEIMFLPFLRQISKWQTYLSYLHLEILRVRNSM